MRVFVRERTTEREKKRERRIERRKYVHVKYVVGPSSLNTESETEFETSSDQFRGKRIQLFFSSDYPKK